MPIKDRSKREVDRRLSRLRDEYGTFPVDEKTVTNDPEFFEHGRDLVKDGWIGDAGAWVTDDSNRVLLIRHSGSTDQWGTPGGGHEPEETMEETALREVREETGIDCTITDVFWARRKTVVLETDPDQRFYMLTVQFEADSEGGEISISDEEVVEARWFSESPGNVADFLEGRVQTWNSRSDQ
ncbi:NUDIX domain-containing protein [Natronolimnobius sp. AArcel1]|uniref:NUDIX hydrolase n=1 Tax=Natronolimnobius sp. AArcel1 TaxID=1679093 RepID=UPI0013EAE420|nr:NUDIX domain-containing protein [Natronolimnobius sp. AArcel1]NGM68642.1 NUDIX domain-containing protein [Natronolimnobius sp. AArcel1]